MAGRRALAREDLLNRFFVDDGIRPSYLQMLFEGGPARAVATDDLRMSKAGSRPKPDVSRMLFRGGPARAVATHDLRMGRDSEGVEPANLRMLSEGGEFDEGDEGDDEYADGEMSEAAIGLAEDLCDALSGYMGPTPSDSDSKVERATKEAARRAKAKIVAQIVRSLVQEFDVD